MASSEKPLWKGECQRDKYMACVYRQRFLYGFGAVLELALVDQAGLELTEIHLPLPPECWD
ncbi:hypothetical protein ACRRTK_020385 [Alexandromys fortis]